MTEHHRTPMPDPAELDTVEQLRVALRAVKRASRLSLTDIVNRSDELAHGRRRWSLGPSGRRPVQLGASNVGGFTGGARPQLPGEDALITFLVVCGTPVRDLPEWVRALRRAGAARSQPRPSPLPRLPEQFVPRPAEQERVITELRRLARVGGGALGLASTAALHGTGGFGKTTLALDVCHSDEVRWLFPDGVVWVEIGQAPVLTAVLADVAALVSERPPVRFGTVDAASAALVAALGDRRVLLVLDNVWQAADLEPFLRGGPRCVRLVTSRRADVLPAGARVLSVDRMDPDQAVALLRRDLPGATDRAVYPLYERSHRWPVVLGMLNGIMRSRSVRSSGQPIDELVADMAARLDRLGLTGADELTDPEVRTARDVLGISVDELATGPNGDLRRDRYLSLAAFPPDQLVTFGVLEQLWECDRLEVRTTCDRFADRSLLGSSDRDGVRLHDVIRDHLVRDHRATVRDWSVTLLAVLRGRCAHGEWHRISDDTADDLDQLAFLLVSTGHDDELRELLFDLRFLVRRMRQGGVAGLSADLAVCQSAAARDPWLAALGRIVDLEGHLAMRVEDPASTAATLYSRLAGDPAVRDLLTHRDAALTDSLAVSHPLPDRPDSRLCRVISGHTERVIAVCWRPDGRQLASGSADGTLRIWDAAGRMLRVVELEAAVNALAWSPDQLHVAALVGESSVCRIEPILGEVRPGVVDTVELTCLAWSPDSETLAVGRGDGTVRLWNGAADSVAAGAVSPSAVRAMDWSHWCGLLIVHSDGTMARLERRPSRAAQTGLNVPRSLAARPGYEEAAVGAAANGVFLVSVADEPRIFAHSGEATGWVTSTSWSCDGTWLAAGLQDGAVALWSTTRDGVRDVLPDSPERRRWEETFAGQPRLEYHGVRVATVSWHPDRPHLAVGAHTDVRIFDASVPFDWTMRQGVSCLRWHPHRAVFVVGTMDGEVIVIDGADPSVRRTVEAHAGDVRSLAFSPDGDRLLSLAEDGPALLWVFDDDLESVPVRCPVTLPGAAAWSPDGRWVAVGGQGEVALLDASDFAVLRLFEVKDLVNSLDVDPSGQRIAVGTSGSTITVHPVAGGETRRLDGHLSSVGVVRWADAGQLLVSGGYDGQAVAWSVADATPSTMFDPGGGAVWDLAVSGDDVLTATSAGLLSLHSLNQGTTRCRVALDTALSSCGFSRVGRLAAAGGSAGAAVFHVPAPP